MRFIINRTGTQVWHEVSPDTILDWVKTDSPKDKDLQSRTATFLTHAKHGEIYEYGINKIVALEIK